MNKELKFLLEQHDAATTEIDALEIKKNEIGKRAVEHCIVKVGDVIANRSYSHHGKNMKVVTITLVNQNDEFQFVARGIILNKHGGETSYRGASYFHLDGKAKAGKHL